MNLIKNIILHIISQSPQTRAQFDRARHQASRKFKTVQPSNNELLSAYHKLRKSKSVKEDKKLEYLLRKAAVRTLSGVAIVTSLTKPHPCPGKCVYCPKEAGMPKSYLSNEPAAARALGLNFDPYEQMARRIEMLETNGHPTDKIEFIVKGGSWNAYPLAYQYNFILQSFKAANSLKHKNIKTLKQQLNNRTIEQLQLSLQVEQSKNESARHRIIGLTLETRPDLITPDTIYHMRQMGCTRVELGLQAPDDKILKLTRRGHTVQQFKDAMLLLRQAGFKVDLHFMPGLPGSTAKHDVEMYKQIFSDPGLKPDMIKIYPCSVIKNTELYKWYKQGKYKPYTNPPSRGYGVASKKLINALIEMKLATPRYCRISRMIRDIPEPSIEAGNKVTNLRQDLVTEMQKRGVKCKCLRCREIGHSTLALKHLSTLAPILFVDRYKTVGGTEYFLSYEDPKRQVVLAFCRLRLPHDGGHAFIRELHTYGQLVALKHKNIKTLKQGEVQHTGLGKKLMAEAEKIVKKNKFKKLAVISGVGVRGYYRKLGYRKEGTYMTKKI